MPCDDNIFNMPFERKTEETEGVWGNQTHTLKCRFIKDL